MKPLVFSILPALCIPLQVFSLDILADSSQHAAAIRGDSVSHDNARAAALQFSADSLTLAREREFEMSSRGGARVEVYLYDGSKMYGDLIGARDSGLSIYVYRDFSYSVAHTLSSGVHNFDFRETDRLVVKGRSRVLQGVFIGFLGGLIAGTVMTRVVQPTDSRADFMGPGAVGGVGLLMGGTIGYLTSGEDLVFKRFDSNELAFLKTLCRNR